MYRILFGLVLVSAKGLSSFSNRGFSSSYLLFCGVIIVICNNYFLHGKLLRQVPDLDESQDIVVSTREECCVVIGDCYPQEVPGLPTRVNYSLDLVIVSVILIVWVVCKLMILCLKFGDDLLLEIYYPIFGLHFLAGGGALTSGICTPCEEWISFGFFASLLVEEGLSVVLEKNSSESDHAPTISSPV
ncbi:uncharacterized protein LOC113273642 [Papaver somniferum]|uniref:uncharacterized protein LOC113273642 n=1 Tax=Papaver somniferum TaxID=3469 RepID=UPI000E704830|nr:uncharacterized protein LOC113273642 [Papaver somniferum]